MQDFLPCPILCLSRCVPCSPPLSLQTFTGITIKLFGKIANAIAPIAIFMAQLAEQSLLIRVAIARRIRYEHRTTIRKSHSTAAPMQGSVSSVAYPLQTSRRGDPNEK
jgi:hypothetical protein